MQFRPRRPRRPLRDRQAFAPQLNACFTGWPGGLNYYPPGAALPGGWVRTATEKGRATNPKCFPPSGEAKLDVVNDGSFAGARRASLLAHRDPAATAREIESIQRASDRGALKPETAAKLIGELAAPPIAASQQAHPVARTPEEAAALEEGRRLGLFGDGYLSLRQVEAQCGSKEGPWACYTRWPGGWLPYDAPAVKAHPDVWKGPHKYGGRPPAGCYGFTGSLKDVGRWALSFFRPTDTPLPPLPPRKPRATLAAGLGDVPTSEISWTPGATVTPPATPAGEPGASSGHPIVSRGMFDRGPYLGVDGKWYLIVGGL